MFPQCVDELIEAALCLTGSGFGNENLLELVNLPGRDAPHAGRARTLHGVEVDDAGIVAGQNPLAAETHPAGVDAPAARALPARRGGPPQPQLVLGGLRGPLLLGLIAGIVTRPVVSREPLI